MRTLVFDIVDAIRSLRRDRAYAATVVVTLALTIGATTAVFSIVNGVLLKPLGYRTRDRHGRHAIQRRRRDAVGVQPAACRAVDGERRRVRAAARGRRLGRRPQRRRDRAPARWRDGRTGARGARCAAGAGERD